MLRATAFALVLGAAATAATALPALAQQGYGAAYGYNAPAYYPVAPAPAVPVRPGTRIYSTSPAGTATVYVAPRNCGVYRYWDGAQCVDAREIPPPLDRDRPIR